MNNRKVPLMYAQFNVYVDGGNKLLGLAEVTLPAFAAMAETFSGAGIMGEIEVPVTGHFSAMTLSMSFRTLYGDPLDFVVGKPYRFDLRSALELEDPASYEREVAKERWSIIGPVKSINPGKRAAQSAADATIDVACRRVEHFMDGKQVLEFDPTNDIYKVNGVDMYAAIRDSVS